MGWQTACIHGEGTTAVAFATLAGLPGLGTSSSPAMGSRESIQCQSLNGSRGRFAKNKGFGYEGIAAHMTPCGLNDGHLGGRCFGDFRK
jgi:hypothetical protein